MTNRERVDAFLKKAQEYLEGALSLYAEGDELLAETQNSPPGDGTVDEATWKLLKQAIETLARARWTTVQLAPQNRERFKERESAIDRMVNLCDRTFNDDEDIPL